MLNGFADTCVNIFKIDNYNQVYQTKLYQDIILFVRTGLKTVQCATPEQFVSLQKEYSQKSILPEEYVADIVVF